MLLNPSASYLLFLWSYGSPVLFAVQRNHMIHFAAPCSSAAGCCGNFLLRLLRLCCFARVFAHILTALCAALEESRRHLRKHGISQKKFINTHFSLPSHSTHRSRPFLLLH